jgi:signal transduction histidine kinase/ActR/RegA family two-component response regulator
MSGLRLTDVPIRRKLTIVTVLTSGAAVLLVCVAFFAYEVAGFRRTALEQAATQANVVGYNVVSALLFKDPADAAATLAALRADPTVLAAAVYDEAGTRFATYEGRGATGHPALPERMDTSARSATFAANHLTVVRPIVGDASHVGTVVVVADLSGLRGRLFGYLGIALLVLLAALAAAIAMSWSLQRTISQPILDLVETTRTVSEKKDYSLRARPGGSDEIGLLIASFNDMLAAIQERDEELKQARDAADAGNRAKDEFLAVVSHELRTPLSPILTWTRLLIGGALDPAATARALESIDRSARAQAQLIDDLLDVSRIVAGKVRLDLQQVELAPILEAAIDSTRPTAETKGIRLQTFVDPRAGFVAGDAGRLQQVFWNLLTNAIKFTPKGGRVQVQLRRVSSHVEVSVSDTGQGIDATFLPQIFERFRQADSSTRRAHGGLGLGLAIVRQLVELHGGTVRAESAGEGQGATFTVELPISLLRSQPVVEQAHPATSGPVPFTPSPVLHGARLLVVDDEPDTLETLRTVLALCGAEVQTAASAAAALAVLESFDPTVLISDIGMPGEDGYAFIRRVRALPAERGGAVPALALTAYARVEDRVRVLDAGFQMHAPKPIEPAELVALVVSLTGRRGGPAAGRDGA